MSSEIEITGTSIERATRSAVRWRVPVSDVGTFGFGHEVHVGAGDAAGVGGQDDGAVHLGQLREPLRAEGGVEQEPAGADVEHLGPVAHHDQAAHLRLEDPVEPVAQRRAGRDDAERRHELGRCGGAPSPDVTGRPVVDCWASRRLRRRVGVRRSSVQTSRTASSRVATRSTSMPGQLERRAGRHDRAPEPEARRLRQPASGLVHLAQLATEADLAARHDVGGHRRRPDPRRRERERQREVGARARPPSPRRPPRCGRRARRTASATCCCSTATTSASRPLSRPCAERRGVGMAERRDERLHLDEQRAVTVEHGRDHRAGRAGPPVGEEQRGRVGHALEPAVGHLEEAELVGGAEAVLHGAQQAQRVVALALEGQHGVDEVLEHPRARQRRRPW